MAGRHHILLAILAALIGSLLFGAAPASAAGTLLCPTAKNKVRLSAEQVRDSVARIQEIVRQGEERRRKWYQMHPAESEFVQETTFTPEEEKNYDETGDPYRTSRKLCNLDLSNLDLSNIDLSYFEINRINFARSNLSGAKFRSVAFQNPYVNFSYANMKSADLSYSEFSHANFYRANLADADLEMTQIIDSNFQETKISNATIRYTFFDRSSFAPVGTPNEENFGVIHGLDSVEFDFGQQGALVQLRELLKRKGLRNEERAATYAIERNTTRYMLKDGWKIDRIIEGAFRVVAFEWTTGYGLYPSLALWLIVLLFILMIPIYAIPISRRGGAGKHAGIYLVLPKDRVVVHGGKPSVENQVAVRRLFKPGRKAWKWATHFSLLSAFHIGFRELNVGVWISRTQPRKFSLEPVGWVRALSGVQSLLSLYLLAIWVLTYFGRPFQ